MYWGLGGGFRLLFFLAAEQAEAAVAGDGVDLWGGEDFKPQRWSPSDWQSINHKERRELLGRTRCTPRPVPPSGHPNPQKGGGGGGGGIAVIDCGFGASVVPARPAVAEWFSLVDSGILADFHRGCA